jgi:ABC-2 type transport system permease protein
MFERIRRMIIKEFLQIFRDPSMKAIIFVVPIIQSLVFGYAVTLDVKNIKTVVYDSDNSPLSREIAADFFHTRYFTPLGNIQNDQELDAAIDKREARLVLHMPPNFEKKLHRGQGAPLQVIIDGSEANSAGIIASYTTNLLERFSQNWIEEHQEISPLVTLEPRAWFNPNLESRNYFVPGVLAILITLITLTLTSMAIVREKEIGTMDQILVTPITPFEFIIGKTVPFVIIGCIDVAVILLVATLWFEVPIRGSFLVLFTAILFYLCTTLGLGLFVSTICTTQQQALMSAFLIYFPLALLSGFIFPVNNMPTVIRYLTLFNPLRHFLTVIRGVFLKGIGWEILWPQIAALAMMGLIILWLATRRFHKTL